MNLRKVYKKSTTGTSILKELLQNIFVAEFIKPSKKIWIVSPWISEFTLIDNKSGNFDIINPDWRGRDILFSDVIIHLLYGGSKVSIIYRPDMRSDVFVSMLKEKAKENNVFENLTIIQRELKHNKGILTDHGSLSGSMNFTYTGVEISEELIQYDIDISRVDKDKIEFEEDYGKI